MAHMEQHIDMDEKPTDIEHSEVKALAEVNYELKKSRFDDLSIPRTLWVFRRTVLVVLSVYTGKFHFDLHVIDVLSAVGYLCEGFEVGTVPVLRRSTFRPSRIS